MVTIKNICAIRKNYKIDPTCSYTPTIYLAADRILEQKDQLKAPVTNP